MNKEDSNTAPSAQTNPHKRTLVGIAAFGGVLALVGALAFGGLLDFSRDDTVNRVTVATVNGEAITQEELTREIDATLAGFGITPESEQYAAMREEIRTSALDNLIATALLYQKAQAEGVVVTDEELSAEIANITELSGGDEALVSQLAAVGLAREDVDGIVAKNLAIQKLLDANVGTEGQEPTDEEVRAAYEAQYGSEENAPALAELESLIRDSLRAQTLQQSYLRYIESLKEEADIEIS